MPRVSGRRAAKRFPALLAATLVAVVALGYALSVVASLPRKGQEPAAEGVYLYEGRNWVRWSPPNGSAWVPADEGAYVVYFRNLECSYCKQFSPVWSDFVRKYAKALNVTPVEVVCTWFTYYCSDQAAKATFGLFMYYGLQPATPALVVVANKTIVAMHYGALSSPEAVRDLVKDSLRS